MSDPVSGGRARREPESSGRRRRRRAVAVLSLCAGAAHAAPSTVPATDTVLPQWWRGAWTLQVENDKIANTDRHYTNGVRLAWVSDRRDDGPEWTRRLLEWLYPLADLRGARAGLAIGQNIYTPANTETTAFQPNDRPYAGWVYVEASLHAEAIGDTVFGHQTDTLDSVALNLGWVGPRAFGEEVQNGFHELIGVDPANGWQHQLPDEPTIALMGGRRWRPAPVAVAGLELGAVPFVGGSLGNSFTMLSGGATLRLGQRLDKDWGPPLIRPTFSGLASLDAGTDLGWYVFAGVEARAMFRNLFLDGTQFRDSHSVSRRRWVGDFQTGVAVSWRGVRVALTHVLRTEEFRGQDHPDRYGVFSISTRF